MSDDFRLEIGDGMTPESFTAIADLKSIEMPEMSLPDMSSDPLPGLMQMGPVTIEGRWATHDEPYWLGSVDLRDLPRKTKKVMQKFATGRPLGRRERARGWRVRLDSGAWARVWPE